MTDAAIKPGWTRESGYDVPPQGGARAFPLAPPDRVTVREVQTAAGDLANKDEHALAQAAAQQKLAEAHNVERFYALREGWRGKSAAVTECAQRFRDARSARMALEERCRSREREFASIRSAQASALAVGVMGAASALPVAELLEVKRARELEAALRAEHERRLESARAAGAVVSGCENYLKRLGVEIEGLR